MVGEQYVRWGRAYRDGRLVAARVHVTIVIDPRIGVHPPAPSHVHVRFMQGIDTGLRRELVTLVCGRRKRRADRSAPIKVVWEEPPRGFDQGHRHARVGRLEAPARDYVLLEEVDFRLRSP